jgi:hypothetical protein
VADSADSDGKWMSAKLWGVAKPTAPVPCPSCGGALIVQQDDAAGTMFHCTREALFWIAQSRFGASTEPCARRSAAIDQ